MMIILIAGLLETLLLIGAGILLSRTGFPKGRIIPASFLFFGLLIGTASAILWPLDLSVYINLPGTWVGDKVYSLSIGLFGNPYSDQAHYTIPWILRVPQIYAMISPVVFGIMGFLLQFSLDHMNNRSKKKND
jgi:hypothetical protein